MEITKGNMGEFRLREKRDWSRSRLVTGTCHAQNPIFGRILGLGGNAVRPRDDGWRRREWLADM